MTRALLVLVGVSLAGCGSPRTTNTMISAPSPLAAVGAPHLTVIVSNEDGLHRVWLDSGRTELIDAAPRAIPISDSTHIYLANERFVIQRGEERTRVPDVRADHEVVVSTDGRRFAVEQAGAEIAIVTIDDATVQRVAIPPRRANQPALSFVWAKDNGSLLVLDDGERYRLDLATAARTPIDALDWDANAPQRPTDCRARGLRLERRARHHRQEIVLLTLAGASNPEQLPQLADRVLVASTDYPDPWTGDGAVNLGKKRPDTLGVASFTPSCEHFLFMLEGRTYLGNVATGRFAFLARGAPVWLPTAPPPGSR